MEKESDLLHGQSDDVQVVLEGSAVEDGVGVAILAVDTLRVVLYEGLQHPA